MKKNKSQSTLKPVNVIGIKSNMEYRLPMAIFTSIVTLVTMYSIARIALDSFRLLKYTPAGPYLTSFADSELKKFYFILAAGCALICIVNSLKKHSLKASISLFVLYALYFVIHYKYVANGFVHALNKSIYAVLAEQGQTSDIYYLTYFEMYDMKTELMYFIATVVFGTCFLLAYSSISRCVPVLFTAIVLVYVGVPFALDIFIGEKYLVYAGVVCILMFIINFQGYSNLSTKKIFASFGNSIKIRGRYASFAAFQQAIAVILCTVTVLGTANIFYDFENYHRSENIDKLGRNLMYSVQNIASTGSFISLGNTSNSLNNGDLTRMGDLNYTGETMFEVKTTPSAGIAPLYLRSFTAADYSNERWTAIPKNTYKDYDFWSEFERDKFYPQLCSGDIAVNKTSPVNFTDISIINRNINPKIFLGEYRTVSGETEILSDITADYDNEFRFNAFGGVESYDQSAVIRGVVSKDEIYLDNETVDEDFYNILHDGRFSYADLSSVYDPAENRDETYESFMHNEKLYRAFVVENYLDYPDGMESYLPSDFDIIVQAAYTSEFYNSVSEYSDYYTLDEYQSTFSQYNPLIVSNYYNDIIWYVKDYIQSNAEYTLSPGVTPQGKELVEYFLTENHKGYCVHFATAATLMLRRAGIPARYVEGYFVSEADLRRANSEGYSKIPDSNAHAWTEVYYPLIGWQVVDFTPYYSEEILPAENTVYKDTDSSSDTDSSTETDVETDTDSDTESDTASDTDSELESDSDSSGETVTSDTADSDGEAVPPQQESRFTAFLKAAWGVILNILKIALTLVLIAAIWFLIRFIVLKIRHSRLNSKDRRKGARAMYLHSLWLLRILGIVPKKGEGDREFASRAVADIEGVKTSEFEEFTDFALGARFGKNSPNEQIVSQMNEFITNLSERVYDSSGKCKKLIIKYILFLN